MRAEVGYQWRYLEGRSVERNDHIVAINLFLDTRARKSATPAPQEAHH